MPPLFEPKLRFSDAVYAIETTPKSLRKWLQNEDVILPTGVGDNGEEVKGWKTFSYGDLAILALMRSFVDFGCNVVDANQLAGTIIKASRSTMHSKNMPPDAFIACWLTRQILVWRENDTWGYALPHKIGEFEPPAITYLVIEAPQLFKRVFSRATESNRDGEDDDTDSGE
jgi:hypothetical protein